MIQKKRKAVSLIIVVLSITSLLGFTAFVVDVGIILNAQLELQKAVETSVLAGASEFAIRKSGTTVSINTTKAKTTAELVFNTIITTNPLISNAVLTKPTGVNASSKAIKMNVSAEVKTYFLGLVGINTVQVTAKSAAMDSPMYLSRNFPLASFATGGNIFNKGSIVKDTSIDSELRTSVGDNDNIFANFSNLYGPPDNKPAALGPGGYITIRLPIPVIDGPGADLFIREIGNPKGYYVFAGIDVNPNNPYTNEAMPGSGVKWLNISCKGFPTNSLNSSSTTDASIGSYTVGGKAKFYGSGFFDLASTCNGSSAIKAAKYLRIIDDNVEDGYMAIDTKLPVVMPGDHSSISPGANIDSIAIMNHSRLITTADFATDSDGDNLIDIVENIIGTDPAKSDTDNDGINDASEYQNWYGSSTTPITSNTTSTVYVTSPLFQDKASGDSATLINTTPILYK